MKLVNPGSEKGFTLLELILVLVVVGILSSSLVLPFMSGMQQGVKPEIYATATYLAQKEIEEHRHRGYTYMSSHLGNIPSYVTKNGRAYTENSTREYVSHSGGAFVTSASVTEFIRVTESVSNSEIPNNVTLWTILTKDFYDPDAN